LSYNDKFDLTPQQIDAMTVIKQVRVYKHGFEIVRGMRFPMSKPEPPERQEIYEMSRKSRLRMAHLVANSEVKWKSLLTLTYGDFFVPSDGKELKRQLNIILKSLRNRFDSEYFWFMEFTKKGKPHFHIILTVNPSEFDRRWLADRWAKITVYDVWKNHTEALMWDEHIGWKDIPEEIMCDERDKVGRVHSHPKTWEAIYKPNGAVRYMLKYATKTEQKLVPVEFGNCGRFWGASRGVEAHLVMTLELGKDITLEKMTEIFSQVLPDDLPLIPKYLFVNNAIALLEGSGISLKELNGQLATEAA